MVQPMNIFDIAAVLLTLAAVFGYLNHRYFKLPVAVAMMLMGLAFSMLLILAGHFYPPLTDVAQKFVERVDFDDTLMKGMLSYLLFAGALHVNLADLSRQKSVIGFLATAGVLASTFLVGTGFYYVLNWMGMEVPYLYCLLFGALISPTDPVAVLGVLKQAGAPKSLETKIAGESLFNDGVGVVVFLVLLKMVTGDLQADMGSIGGLFLVEVLGGVVLGFVLGALGYFLIKGVNEFQIEVLITLALVTGGYSLATHLHMSGPLAMVVAGLMIGNHGRSFAMSDKTREHLDSFWLLIDEILNAVLFVLIGIEILVLNLRWDFVVAGVVAVPVVLLARFLSIGTLVTGLRRFREFSPRAVRIMTWGGLRGGISVALALSLPKDGDGGVRDLFLTATYVVVIFSVSVQGLSLKYLVQGGRKKEGGG